MSLILDALNRSRQDAEQVPGLATEHHSDADLASPPIGRSLLPWIGFVLALLVIAWLLLDREGDRTAGTDAAVVVAPASRAVQMMKASEPAPPPVPAAAPQGSTPGRQAVTPTDAVPSPGPAESKQVLDAQPEPASRTDASPVASAIPPQAMTAQRDDAVTALYASRGATPADKSTRVEETPKEPEAAALPGAEAAASLHKVDEQPVDIEAMLSRAQQEVENARLAEHPAPFITDLSQQTKDRIPTIFYQRHDYSESSASTVVLNSKELRVGGKAASGVTVKEILPDSVVLSFQGTEFRLRALNSWVNL